MSRTFADRAEAGRELARKLLSQDWHEPVVLGLARGGVPVAREVALALDAALDVTVSRKIGAPGRPEFGVGAVTPDGPPTYDQASLRALGLRPDELDRACAQERAEANRRVRRYLAGREPVPVTGRDVILIDDGLATGVTARAAVRQLLESEPRRVVFGAPVCAPEGAAALANEADDVVCVALPEQFRAVGQWYRAFDQISDEEVIDLLRATHR